MAVFTEVVDKGSFRGAAASLGLSPSVISHQVSQLERQLGVALVYRSTRRLTLSPDGHRLFDACRDIVAAAERGLDAVSAVSATAPKGLALAGMGLAPLLDLDVIQELEDNRLQEVLPPWKMPSPSIYALWPANATRTALSRRFVDFLAETSLPRRQVHVTAPPTALR